MRIIQASEAKAKFLSILDAVEEGETVQITRHGRLVARLVPELKEETHAERAKRAFESIRELRKHTGGVTIEEILSARDEGRR